MDGKALEMSSVADLFSSVHDARIERALITSFLASSSAFDEAATILTAEDFYVRANQVIFQACAKLRESGAETDLTAVIAQLSKDGTLDAAGGAMGVATTGDELPDVANVSFYAREVKDLANKRRLGIIAASIAGEALKRNAKAGEIADSAVGSLVLLSEPAADTCAGEYYDIATEIIATSDQRREERKRRAGIITGIDSLDRYMKPMRPGQLITIGARTSVGKTALALQIAGYNAMNGRRVMYNTLEMDKEECVMRSMAQLTDIDTTSIENGEIPPEAEERLGRMMETMSRARFWIDGYRNLTVAALAGRARRRQRLHGLDLLIVDYLQLMVTSGKTESRAQEVSQITRQLKILAGDLGVPIICVSQLNRAAEFRGNDEQDPMPKLIHLRESGSIEQDSNTVLLLHRNMEFAGYGAEYSAKILIAKQRNGVAGVSIPVRWSPVTQKFSDEYEGQAADSVAAQAEGSSMGVKKNTEGTRKEAKRKVPVPVVYEE